MLYILCCIIPLLLKYFKPNRKKACRQYPIHHLRDGKVLPAGLLSFRYSVYDPVLILRIRLCCRVICPMAFCSIFHSS